MSKVRVDRFGRGFLYRLGLSSASVRSVLQWVLDVAGQPVPESAPALLRLILKSLNQLCSGLPKCLSCQQPGYTASSKHREIHLSTAQKYLQCRRSRRSIGVGTFVVDCLRIIRILVVRTGPDLLFYDRLCNKLSS